MAQYMRRAGVLAAGGGIYVVTVYLTMNYVNANKREVDRVAMENETLGISYVNNPQRTDAFQQIAYAYDDEIGKDELVMGVHLLRRALLYFHAKGNMLEVGAGTGRNLDYYPSSTTDKVVLTDTSDKMLERAKEKVKQMSESDQKRFDIKVADAANLSQYKDGEFDTVIDTFGLCSFDDPVVVLKELQRVTSPNGGKILLLEHGRSKTYDGLSKYLDKNAERHAKNWGCVWNRDIDAIVEEAGLEIDIHRTWHFGTTYYMVCRPRTATNTTSTTSNKLLTDNNNKTTSSQNTTIETATPLYGGLSILINSIVHLFYVPTWKCERRNSCSCSHHHPNNHEHSH